MIVGGNWNLDADDVPDLTVSEADVTWNTHRQIREAFGYPSDAEFFGPYLDWFYDLSTEQRVLLRQGSLPFINKDAFPVLPHPTQQLEQS